MQEQVAVAGSPYEDLKHDIDCQLHAFSFDDQEGTTGRWQEFNRVMAKQKAEVQMAMTRILEPFLGYHSPIIDGDAFRALSRSEATELLDGCYCNNV